MLQLDYTADIISRLARAAHVVLEHSENEGLGSPQSGGLHRDQQKVSRDAVQP